MWRQHRICRRYACVCVLGALINAGLVVTTGELMPVANESVQEQGEVLLEPPEPKSADANKQQQDTTKDKKTDKTVSQASAGGAHFKVFSLLALHSPALLYIIYFILNVFIIIALFFLLYLIINF